ncbi:uncharacterized protein ATNIH1004_009249 [Aspergillus tanneri]|uniref:CorA-like transporter domain-containing protein n=1 Tax=Aspergillus tanneri TaxID=1220188 RepID=A0A5M9MDK9_9EURO|nr:uncharacterized protein ATNIH1004_009249 [Aspergillus tanneri]KAA8645038.1 hypothetical protein ATNIH1004_009249 [Aspergillus tanneri]
MVAPPKPDTTAPGPDEFDPFCYIPYPRDYRKRAESRKCFQKDESNVQVDWTEVNLGESGETITRSFGSLADLQSYRAQIRGRAGTLRMISISQANSWRPLNVTVEMLEEIVSATGCSLQLLNLALSFCEKSVATEEAYSSAPMFSYNGRYFEVAYIFKYAFPKAKDNKTEAWALRQTGVYHKYDSEIDQSTWIFMNPTKSCLFQERLGQMRLSSEYDTAFKIHPLLVHHILFTTFFPNWRDYLASYEARVLAVSNTTTTQRVQETLNVNHQTLTFIRSVEARCLPLRAIFCSFDKTLQILRKANDVLRDCGRVDHAPWMAMEQLLGNYKNHLEAYSQGAAFLQNRTATTAHLITDTFSFKNSHRAHEQTEHMLDLTLSTVDDSTTVRVITVVTLIYLPSTFVAVGLSSPVPV